MSANSDILVAPIHRLNHDLLWYILKINGNMFLDNEALDTTRAASQVCQDWRNFMLATPSLWGKLIDLDRLNRSNDAWRNELLRRSGTSPLWVKAQKYELTHRPKNPVTFFFDILHANWQRIEKLVVKIDVRGINPTQWAPLCFPAPYLQIFDLTFWETMDAQALEKSSFGPLFANQAPMLFRFSAKAYPFDLQAPWLHQLRSLGISTALDMCDLLTALQSIPGLEILRVECAILGDSSTPLPRVSLNNLRRLALSIIDLKRAATLLFHLHIPPSCWLRFRPHAIRDSDGITEHIFRTTIQTISKLARRHFQTSAPRKISLHCSGTSIKFRDVTDPQTSFEVSINYGSINFLNSRPPYVTATLLTELALPELSKVTALNLRIETDVPTPLFVSFLASLPCVNTITANETTIDYLLQVRDDLRKTADPHVIFPLVKRIELTNIYSFLTRRKPVVVLRFLLSRIGDRCPIEVLDLTELECCFTPNLDFLKEVTGLRLTVIWKSSEEGVLEYVWKR